MNQQASVTEVPSEVPAAVAAVAPNPDPAQGPEALSSSAGQSNPDTRNAEVSPESDPAAMQADTAAGADSQIASAATAASDSLSAPIGSAAPDSSPASAGSGAATAPAGPEPSARPYFGNTYPNNPNLQVSERFKALRRKSGYIMGWLKLDGVDEPVVQKDNSFFLTHDAMGKKNINGAIFLDQSISLLTRPNAIFLFGHNMKTGAMFGNLRKFEKSSYYFNHWIISFDSLYDEGGKYIVFGVCKPGVVRGARQYADVYDLLSNDSDLRAQALEDLLESNMHAKVVNVTADDQLLLLITCTNDDTERLIIAARRLRDGETEDRLDLDM